MSKFLIHDYNTGWTRSDERPVGRDFRGAVYTTFPPVVVHVGTKAKNAPVTVVAIDRRGEELVVEPAGGRPGTIWVRDTIEGRLFTRSVVKLVKVLAQLARKGQTAINKKDREDKRARERAGREGTCQICENCQIVADKGTLVLHGYERPGIGYVVGRCYGFGELPWEKSCEALRRFIPEILEALLRARKDELETVKNATKFTVKKWDDTVVVYTKRANKYEFKAEQENRLWWLGQEITNLERDIVRQTARLESWVAK